MKFNRVGKQIGLKHGTSKYSTHRLVNASDARWLATMMSQYIRQSQIDSIMQDIKDHIHADGGTMAIMSLATNTGRR